MFQVGDKVKRVKNNDGTMQIVPAGTLGEIVRVGISGYVDVVFDDWSGSADLQRMQNYSHPDKFIEKVGVIKPVKTWEMMRDIKVGEVWSNQNGMAVVLHVRAKGIVWEVSEAPVVFTSTMLETYEWTKQQKFVDFAEAWDAYENGKAVKSKVTGYKKEHGDASAFMPQEIRGKWEVLD